MCKEIKGDIDAGAYFSSKAKEHSKCPSSQKGGDLGTFKRGQMVQEFDEVCALYLSSCSLSSSVDCNVQVVFAGRPGVLYGPVKTQFGWHLIVIKSLS